ncbi:conserved membrane hypothetical protein [Rubrivivax sp. A210]|uniref:hypothetical protein n=1 Tax=Rubrivivax sp. A210 TaxID=2772301 RepID=UPI00191A4EC7|nr:hypothetical protein [Rubrivivax sp. A210]CAD5373527.1 conserved membrane hypothetical protein [Rubrivivax sp. A210]
MQPSNISLRVGQCDATLVLIAWSALWSFFASQPLAALPVLAFISAPLALLVGWRGQAHATRLLTGQASLRASVVEGACIGALAAIALFVLPWLVPRAFAAGHYLDDFDPSKPKEWVSLTWALALPTSGGAVVGALHAVGLHYFNIHLVARWAVR